VGCRLVRKIVFHGVVLFEEMPATPEQYSVCGYVLIYVLFIESIWKKRRMV